jgi:hypothetical protein
MLQSSLLPHPHVILDSFCPPDELEAINSAWPGGDWPGWHHYDPAYEHKKVSNLTEPIPPALSVWLAKMSLLPIGTWLGMPNVVVDLSLIGSGLHESPPGGKLDCHLDADTHPRLGLQRAFSAILYVTPQWQPSHHGRFLLCNDKKEVMVSIDPIPGRLIAFDCRNAWHGVQLIGDDAPPRRSLSIFGYLPKEAKRERLRAKFTPWPGQESASVLHAMRCR